MERAVVFRQEQCDLQGPFGIATIMQDHRVPTLKPEPSVHPPLGRFRSAALWANLYARSHLLWT